MDGDAQATGMQRGGRDLEAVSSPAFTPLGCPRAGENSAPDVNFPGVSMMSWGERFPLYFPVLRYDPLLP